MVKRFLGTIPWVVLVFGITLMAACGADQGGESTTAPLTEQANGTPAETTAEVPVVAGPPCYGLEQTDSLPDWVGEGMAPSHPADPDRDGCVVDQGVIVVATELDSSLGRRFVIAAVDDCVAFGAAMVDLPSDLRIPPDAIQSWLCFEPAQSAEGTTGIRYITMEGTEPAQG